MQRSQNLPLAKSLLKLVQEICLSTQCSEYLHAFAYPSFISILKKNLDKFCAQSGIYNPSSFL